MTLTPTFIQPDAAAVARALRASGMRRHAPWLHTEVARRMQERMSALRTPPKTILNWWAHWGGSNSVLKAAYQGSQIMDVEPQGFVYDARSISRAGHFFMPKSWAAWLKNQCRVLFKSLTRKIISDAEVPEKSCDGIWANMMLHLAPDVPELLSQWHQSLHTNGILMFSTLGPDSFASLRQIYSRLGWGFPAQAFADMHHLGDALVKAGFADPVIDQEHLTLTWSDASALLAEIRTWGRNAHAQRYVGLRSRRWYKQMLLALEDLKQADGRIALELELVYGHAIKPMPRVALDPVAHISLDQMRKMVKLRQ